MDTPSFVIYIRIYGLGGFTKSPTRVLAPNLKFHIHSTYTVVVTVLNHLCTSFDQHLGTMKTKLGRISNMNTDSVNSDKFKYFFHPNAEKSTDIIVNEITKND